MLKREIKFEDFDGNKVTEVHYFNLTKSELLEWETSYKNGLEAVIKRIAETEDREGLIREFKKIILMSYGVRSEDGKRFIKSDELRTEFTQSLAYDALFMELAQDDQAASDFVIGILPKDIGKEAAQTVLPPPPPSTSVEVVE